MNTHANPVYAYRRSPDQDGGAAHHPVIVVGAGPVGMAAAIDLAQHDIPVLVLDEDHTVSVGSRAICWAKRTLEILDRLGCGEPVARKGVSWNVGKVFHGTTSSSSSICCPNMAIAARRSSTCSSITSRNSWSNVRPHCRRPRSAG